MLRSINVVKNTHFIPATRDFFFGQLLITVQFLRRFDNLKIHYEGFRTTLAI